jgi:hypothetical protein
MDAEDLIDTIATLRDSGAWLGPRSDDFLNGLLSRARRYDAVFLSAKQKQWLDDLIRKAGSAAP